MRVAVVLLVTYLAVTQAGWEDLFKFPWTKCPLSFMFAVQCPNASMCLMAGGESNTEMGVYYTTDNFNSTIRAKMDHTGLMLLDMRMGSATHGVAAGVGFLKLPGLIYTRNSYEWHSSDDLWLVSGQCAGKIDDNTFTFVGGINDIEAKDGVAISKTGGLTWENKAFPASVVAKLPGTANCSARYGAFPSHTTWYVTAGSWPGENASNPTSPVKWLNSRIGVPMTEQRNKIVRRALEMPKNPQDVGYTAAILKTTDGGSNYEIMYTSTGKYYFNDIGCLDENTCVALAEGFGADGSTDPGARIMRTEDGGKTWTTVHQGEDGTSAMRMKIVSSTEIWTAVGNIRSELKMAAVFMQSKDGGKTWVAADTIKGVGDVMSIDFVNPTLGYATGITEADNMTPMKYTA